MTTVSQSLAIAVLMVFIAMSNAVTAGDDKQPQFKIMANRDNDKVDV